MVVYIIIILILIAFKLWWDLRQQSKGIVINHTLSAFIDILMYFSAAIIIQVYSGDKVSCIRATSWLVIGLYIRWVITDIAHSIKTNGWGNWHYLGDYSLMDKLGKKIGEEVYFSLRILVPIIYLVVKNLT